MSEKTIVVIGAGVVGASSALALQLDGHKVILIDKDEPCAGASFGNAGGIVDSSCVPTAMPGIIYDVVKMLGQRNSPFTVRPAYLPQMMPWLIRFLWQSRKSAAYSNARDLYSLTRHAAESWRQLTDNTQLSALLVKAGWLKVYENERSFMGAQKSRDLMQAVGTEFEVLNRHEIRDLEPNLAHIYQYGFFQKDSLNITNPQKLVQGMVDLLVSRGATYQKFDVRNIRLRSDGITLHGVVGEIVADKLVIATGAWSRPLAKQQGDDVPLDTERGYHLMLPEESRGLLNRPVVNGDLSFVLSPMDMGIRMTSQVELSGLTAQPNYAKVRNLLPQAKRMLPQLKAEEKSVWLGFRPSLPDSLPVMGFSSNSDKVVYAFGHQHLGMTLGAISGFLVADLFSGRKPRVDLSPYRANRF